MNYPTSWLQIFSEMYVLLVLVVTSVSLVPAARQERFTATGQFQQCCAKEIGNNLCTQQLCNYDTISPLQVLTTGYPWVKNVYWDTFVPNAFLLSASHTRAVRFLDTFCDDHVLPMCCVDQKASGVNLSHSLATARNVTNTSVHKDHWQFYSTI